MENETIPEELRRLLIEKGYSNIEIGNARLGLADGRWRRRISLDDALVTDVEFPDAEIDWGIVAGALG